VSVSELEMGENVLGDRRRCELPMRKTTECETERRARLGECRLWAFVRVGRFKVVDKVPFGGRRLDDRVW
jgi:hypothetical protein